MWWREPAYRGFDFLLPERLLTLIAKAYVLVLAGTQTRGTEAGRQLEKAFYSISACAGMQLCQKAGSRSLFSFKSCSGYAHEIDGSIAQQMAMSAWELKNLQGCVPKNDLLIFNSKILDYYLSFDGQYYAIPLYRLLLTTCELDLECRQYGASNGIMVIDPNLLPIPLLYEALSRGFSTTKLEYALEAAQTLRWPCRSMQEVLIDWSRPPSISGTNAARARASIELQTQLSATVSERLQQEWPDWEASLLDRAWRETGGWAF
jgi:hypothetical protein